MTLDPSGLPSYAEDRLAGVCAAAFDRIRSEAARIGMAFGKVVDDLRVVARYLSPLALATLEDVLRRTRAAIEKMSRLVTHALESQVSILSLIHRSVDWRYGVRKPVSSLSLSMVDPSGQPGRQANPGLPAWQGTAATVYREKVGRQQAAANSLAEGAAHLSDWLLSIAESNVEYVVKLADVLAGVAGKLGDAAGKTGSARLVPSAMDDLLDIPDTLVAEGIAALADVGVRFVRAVGAVQEIKAALTNEAVFPGRQWPKVTR